MFIYFFKKDNLKRINRNKFFSCGFTNLFILKTCVLFSALSVFPISLTISKLVYPMLLTISNIKLTMHETCIFGIKK